MEALYLSDSEIDDSRLKKIICKNPNVKRLEVSNNLLTDIGSIHLDSLEHLDVRNNNITDISVINCKNLRFIRLTGNPIRDFSIFRRIPITTLDIHECLELDCNNIPRYGLPGSNFGQYCHIHRDENMIMKRLPPELESINCIICGRTSTHGCIGQQKTRCNMHYLSIHVKTTNPYCKGGCMEMPIYKDSKRQTIPKKCEVHKSLSAIVWEFPEPDSKDVVDEKCEKTGLLKCGKRRREFAVKKLLSDHGLLFSHEIPIGNKAINNPFRMGKSSYKPDFLIEFVPNEAYVIIEVDENQHSGYEGDETRMKSIFYELIDQYNNPNLDLCFIRYNLDKYSDGFGKVHKSNIDRDKIFKKILLKIVKEYQDKRMHYVDTFTRTERDVPLFEVIYLFYDGFHQDRIIRVEVEIPKIIRKPSKNLYPAKKLTTATWTDGYTKKEALDLYLELTGVDLRGRDNLF